MPAHEPAWRERWTRAPRKQQRRGRAHSGIVLLSTRELRCVPSSVVPRLLSLPSLACLPAACPPSRRLLARVLFWFFEWRLGGKPKGRPPPATFQQPGAHRSVEGWVGFNGFAEVRVSEVLLMCSEKNQGRSQQCAQKRTKAEASREPKQRPVPAHSAAPPPCPFVGGECACALPSLPLRRPSLLVPVDGGCRHLSDLPPWRICLAGDEATDHTTNEHTTRRNERGDREGRARD
jgi:hypothetical protein